MKDKSESEKSLVILETDIQNQIDNAQKKSRERRNRDLAVQYEKGQLVSWPEDERGIPNELVRCAVFSAKNRKEKRAIYRANSPLIVPVIGGGQVIYIGEELRQDDETVWMQLVHLAKESCSEYAEFTPYSFIKAIKWPINGASYTRLLTSIRRLATSGLEIYSNRFSMGISINLIFNYEYSKDSDKSWKVQVFNKEDNLFSLFDKLYSRLDLKTRLALPEGITTWLHGFFSSHREPFDHKIETLAVGAGICLSSEEDEKLDNTARVAKRKERLREAKRRITGSLEALKKIKFLSSFEITRGGLVRVVRSQQSLNNY